MKQTETLTLDRGRIEKLSVDLMEHIRENYWKGPISRDRVYEALNALAFCKAVVVQGTGDPKEAQSFFDRALAMQSLDLEQHPPKSWSTGGEFGTSSN
jgi:hypothetical protein